MDNVLVERVVTAAQRLEMAEWDREHARARALLQEHRDTISIEDAQRLTFLPPDELQTLLAGA
ncbi:hypothetical protein [Nocardioides sp.]|uniref:hypothetical protein n=1 Tax=Nocardioides sp. TaxID=35761 RepID=UPI0035AF802E